MFVQKRQTTLRCLLSSYKVSLSYSLRKNKRKELNVSLMIPTHGFILKCVHIPTNWRSLVGHRARVVVVRHTDQQSYGSFIRLSRHCASSWYSYFITLWKDHRQPRSQFDHLCIHSNVSKAANSLFSRTRSRTDKRTEQGNHIYEVYTLCVSISTDTHTQESYGTCSQLGECQHVHWCSVLILEMSARLSLI